MNIILHVNSSDDRAVNKVLTESLTLNINPHFNLNVLNLELILSNIVDINKYNYLEIPEISRLYFIVNVERIGFNVYTLSCECDLISTYSEQILNSDSIFYRSIKPGDFNNSDLIEKLNYSLETYENDFEIGANESSIVMVTMGGE